MQKNHLSSHHPDIESEQDSSLSIFNENSEFGAYYQMIVPFQITLEYCSGTTDKDYYNFLISSQSGTYSFTNPYFESRYYYTNRPLHQHDFFEWMIVLKGEVSQNIENKEYSYPAGTCCFINRNLRHRENFIGETQLLFLNFSVDLLQELFHPAIAPFFQNDNLEENNILQLFIDNDIHTPNQKVYLDFFPNRYNDKSIPFLHMITDKILHEMFYPNYGSTYRIKSLLCTLFERLTNINSFHATEIRLDSKADFLLFCRISHLLEDTNGRISRAELEQALNYTGDYLGRIVKKYTGLRLFDYGMTFCIKKAKTLLKTTDENIDFISRQLGFTNRTHFYKLFREKCGMTPKEYRKKYQ